MPITLEESRWFYRVIWEAQAHPEDICGNSFVASGEICEALQTEMAQALADPSLASYEKALTKIDEMCIAYVLRAFLKMGWKFEPHNRFSKMAMVSSLGIIDKYHQLLERLLEMLVEEGILLRENGFWEVIADSEDMALKSNVQAPFCPEAEAEIALLTRCGPSLAEVLQGRCSPLTLLFPEADMSAVSSIYRESPHTRMINELIEKVVLSALKRIPRERSCRILEVGAGTGGVTSRILPRLRGYDVQYLFTDVAHVFLNKAKTEFKDYPFVQYRILDIEEDPQSQGFELQQFDLIIAANVLHSTRDLPQTLLHIRQMLFPEGMLVLMEGEGPVRWYDLTFGLTEGWWRFRDSDLRPSYPLISPPQWKALLRGTGFVKISSVSLVSPLEPVRQIKLHRQSLIVAHKPLPETDVENQGGWLIFSDKRGLGQRLKALLSSSSESCALVYAGKGFKELGEQEFAIDPAEPEHYRRLLRSLENTPRAMVHLWSLDIPMLPATSSMAGDTFSCSRSMDDSFLPSCGSALHLIQAVREECFDPPSLWLVSRGAQPVGDYPDVPGIAQSPLWGMAKVIALEKSELHCVRIDLDPNGMENEDRVLFEEICSRSGTEDQLAFRSGTRYVSRLVPHHSDLEEKSPAGAGSPVHPPLNLRKDGSYLITGGLGGLGLLVARWMVDRGARSLHLVGRSSPGEEADNIIKGMERTGARVSISRADVSNQKQVEQVFTDIERNLPPLRGIIHAAGILDDGLIGQLNRERFERVMAPKVKGAWHLHALSASRGLSLDFFVLFSSITAVIGNAGQAGYAAANAFMDCLAHHRRAHGLPGLSINWGGWSEVGLLARYPAAIEWLKETGIVGMNPRQGLDVLEFLLSGDYTQIGVVLADWAKFRKRYRLKNAPFFSRLPVAQNGI